MGSVGGFRSNERNIQSKLDSDLKNYFSKSSNFAKRQLDDEIDVYMMNTKHYLDKSIDEYMKAKKELYQIMHLLRDHFKRSYRT